MEVERAIILSLSEPRRYDDLFTKARELRKKAKKTLARQTFNKTLKILVSDDLVKKNPKKEGKVVYEIADSSLARSSKKFFENYEEYHDKKIVTTMESLKKNLAEIIEKNKNEIEITSFDKTNYSLKVSTALMLLLEYQKYLFFFKSTGFIIPSIKSTIQNKIKDIENILSLVLKPVSGILDKESLLAIFEAASRTIESDIKREENNLKVIEEFYQRKK